MFSMHWIDSTRMKQLETRLVKMRQFGKVASYLIKKINAKQHHRCAIQLYIISYIPKSVLTDQ